MRLAHAFLFSLGIAGAASAAIDDLVDRVDEMLITATADGQARARVSGTFDLEAYNFPQPPPGVIHASDHELVVPRLSLFLDAQFGSQVYLFAQARADTGFDPSNESLKARVDECAIRVTFGQGKFNFQLGKFATVVGNWVARHDSWTNPFITAPLPYNQLTGLWDSQVAKNSTALFSWAHLKPLLPSFNNAREKYLRVPIIWGPSYTSGAAFSAQSGKIQFAGELKNGSLSSRPETWQPSETQWQHPTVNGRIGYRLNETWTLGTSASAGSYLRSSAGPTIPAGRGFQDYRQIVVAQDVSFAWHHFQFWAEVFENRFEISNVGNADILSYYTELKYKFTPQFFGALRWNQQIYGDIRDAGQPTPWDHDVWRVDVAPTFRFSSHTQLKLQYSVQYGDIGSFGYNQSAAAQFTLRF